MDTPSRRPFDVQLLLEHGPWMRRLARTLVRDVEQAEELSQETWRRLLERPPVLDRPFRGWIATVMRNLVRAERRGAARRTAREHAVASTEAEPSSHELLERVALQRELVQAVLELEEPYRTTLCLRYFEELTPSDIAARERLPLATVKTRLARGVARLRERLGRTRGPDGQTSLLAALITWHATPAPTIPARPAPAPSAPLLPWTVVPVAMNAKLTVSLVVLVAAAIAYLYAGRDETPARAGARGSALLEAREELSPASPLAAAAPALATRESGAAATLPDSAAAVPVASAPAPLVRGYVIDVGGAPVSGVEIRLSPTESTGAVDLAVAARSAPVVATSGSDGSFEVPGRREGRLFVRDPRWTTLLTGVPVDARSGQECQIVVAPALELSGIVIDEYGAPLPEALVRIVPPADLRARLARVLDFSATVSWRVTSDEDGRFRFPSAPALSAAVLRAELLGYDASEEPAPLSGRTDLALVLTRPTEGAVLRGIVVDAGGSPVEDALVGFGLDAVRTDEDGHFGFHLDDPKSINAQAKGWGWMKAPDDLLRAVKRGFLPAELRASERDDAGLPLWPRPVVLRLGTEALTIGGRVVDERGEPREDVRVWISDPSLFGVERGRSGGDADFVVVEDLLGGEDSGWNFVETDDDGEFELAGLTPRDYALAAMDPDTLLRVVEPLVAAGRHDVELVLGNGGLFPRLAGHVVDGRGDPVPGVEIFPMCDAYELKNFEGSVFSTQHESVDGTETDSEGHFELERIPKDLAYLRLNGSDTIPLEWGRGQEGGLAALVEDEKDVVITVERRCHFQVELAVPAEADELGVLDKRGTALIISEFLGNGRREMERQPLVEGRSNTLAVGDRAATLVLYRGGSEVRRVPLRLAPGAPTTLRL